MHALWEQLKALAVAFSVRFGPEANAKGGARGESVFLKVVQGSLDCWEATV